MKGSSFLDVDLGAESGRAISGYIAHRFPNRPMRAAELQRSAFERREQVDYGSKVP